MELPWGAGEDALRCLPSKSYLLCLYAAFPSAVFRDFSAGQQRDEDCH